MPSGVEARQAGGVANESMATHQTGSREYPVEEQAPTVTDIQGREGWKLHHEAPSGPSKIVRPDGVCAFYRYMPTTQEEARLIVWAYTEGHKHGDSERREALKKTLGL